LGACANQGSNQATTSPSPSVPSGAERMTTQLKSADGSQVANATFDFANGYATVTVEAGPNQVLSPGFTGCKSTRWADARPIRLRRRAARPGTSTPLEASSRRRVTPVIPPAAI
jgi:hypothetical protein